MKIATLLCMMLVVASTASAQKLTFQKGSFSPNYTTEDWNIDKGDGPRSCKVFVQFDNPFLSAPTVLVNLTGIDAPTDHNLRVSLKVEKVSVSGFLLRIETWQDSHINAIEGTWFAISKNE